MSILKVRTSPLIIHITQVYAFTFIFIIFTFRSRVYANNSYLLYIIPIQMRVKLIIILKF